ncbi:hypothetical protein [Bacillus sp. FJAT-45350]|uniref:hypothetical protein n=1 Tax=Bacillus sp. FJAT-45350 TaxID=2011014 RepID=UPI000BB9700E|nr:hypothetical protein [Bacillus sp. FJAT-45350]
MKTHREKQIEEYYKKVQQLDRLIQELNEEGSHLGMETKFTNTRLFKEQNEQLEEIREYFHDVEMPEERNTNEAILTVAVGHFHKFIMEIRGKS